MFFGSAESIWDAQATLWEAIEILWEAFRRNKLFNGPGLEQTQLSILDDVWTYRFPLCSTGLRPLRGRSPADLKDYH